MVTKVRETEWKYDVPPGATLPDLTGLPRAAAMSPPQKQILRAVYHDTADLRLLRAGITLRRRTGGNDAGWHLKLPESDGSRTELRLPTQRDLPPELTALVRAWTRGHALKPVARITTTRLRQLLSDESGITLAEIVVDDVTSESLGETTTLRRWDEVEVELVEGDLHLLKAADKKLRRSGMLRSGRTAKVEFALADMLPEQRGGPPVELTSASSSADVVLAYLGIHIKALISYDPLVRRAEPEAVHEMRVATRRLRSALRTFGGLFEQGEIQWLAEELKWLAGVLGQARDEEVLCDHLLANLSRLPEHLVIGPVKERITSHLAPREAGAQSGVVEALNGDRYLALLSGLDVLLANPPLKSPTSRKGSKQLAPIVAREFRRVDRRLDHAFTMSRGIDKDADQGVGQGVDQGVDQDTDTALHESRKAAKRARYAAEAADPVLGDGIRHSAKIVKQLQSILGDRQDAVLAGPATLELGAIAHANGENAFTYGILHERDATAIPALEAHAEQVWKQAGDKGWLRVEKRRR